MKTRKLNLEEAFQLASILVKYVDIEKITPETDAVEFISSIVDKISPRDYLDSVMLLTHTDVKTIEKKISLDILTAFISGLQTNKVITLIGFYKSLIHAS